MDPGAMLTDVDKLKQVFIEAGYLAVFFEQGFMGARRARGDHHPI
jgi:hypothetical protein